MAHSANELTARLLEFWCNAHGYKLRAIHDDLVVIDHGFGITIWTKDNLANAVGSSLHNASDASALRQLSPSTYEIRHNPNCPKAYEVRTTGRGGVIDHKRADETLNDVGYGSTLAEAAMDNTRMAARRP